MDLTLSAPPLPPQGVRGAPAPPAPSAPADEDLRRRLLEDMTRAGPPASPFPEGSVGVTMFDQPGSEDQTVTVLLARERVQLAPSQALLRIESRADSRR